MSGLPLSLIVQIVVPLSLILIRLRDDEATQSAAQNNPILTTAKIEDAWNSWAFAMFAQQGLIYFVLMACIMIIEWIDNTVRATIGVGWLYFVRLEGLKMWRSFVQYFYNFWNVWRTWTQVVLSMSNDNLEHSFCSILIIRWINTQLKNGPTSKVFTPDLWT